MFGPFCFLQVLTNKKNRIDNEVSVRRFSSFGLLNTALIPNSSNITDCDTDGENTSTEESLREVGSYQWYSYTAAAYPDYEAAVR